MRIFCAKLIHFFVFLLFSSASFALHFDLDSAEQQIVGKPQTIILKQDQSLEQVAREYGVGYYEILEANPKLNPLDLQAGSALFLPTQFILPNTPHDGIVINLAELRMYLYSTDGLSVDTVPVGIGRQGWTTPVGNSAIKDHRKEPYWTVPFSVRDDMARQGVHLPAKMPPGPDNPLGHYAMRITVLGYAIHGTNKPDGVGKRTSAGCIRMYPEDVERLFEQMDVDTPVHIVNQAFKTAWQDGQVYLEAHRPLSEQRLQFKNNPMAPVLSVLEKALIINPAASFDWQQVEMIALQHSGIPYKVSASY